MSAGIWVIHTGGKSGGELVTLFGGYCNDGMSAAGIWVIHTGGKSGDEMLTLFGGYSYDGNECWYMGHTYRWQIWG